MADMFARLRSNLAGRYRLERELGRGGMAIVFQARDLKHDRWVALKVLRPELGAVVGPERFLREIRLAAGLVHPNIVPLYDSGEADGLLYYVMPYLEGESLRDRLVRDHRLSPDVTIQIASEVADALDHAHQRNIVHRDVKPENILLQAGHALVSDFGIARAITEARGSRSTSTGVVVGTIDYMSPEQAAGDAELDGRSDVYSLGCVMYEMLAGTPPAKDTAELPATVPEGLRRTVHRALARRADDRFATAAEVGAALAMPAAARARPGWWRRWGIAAAVVLVGLGAVLLAPQIGGAHLDPALIVVAPFGHRGGAAAGLLNGDRCERLLYSAFSRWEDVRLVNDMQIDDARARQGPAPETFSDAQDLARRFGAGLLVWGQVSQAGDSIEISATLYDVARGTSRRRPPSIRIGADLRNVDVKFTELADSLLLSGARSPGAAAGALRTTQLTAWLAYDSGQAARSAWDLPAAADAFRAAIRLDPSYPDANLWLAQVMEWSGEPAPTWRGNAAAAVLAAHRLPATERQLAEALLALADRRYADACSRYRGVVARDSLSYVAWFGLGECQRLDRAVVRDPASASGWRFRSSYAAAVTAYARAWELVPSVHFAFGDSAVDHLSRVLFIETGEYRSGYAVAADTQRFGAFPALDHDTLAFVPYPLMEVLSGRSWANPPTTGDAVQHDRAVLRRITAGWVWAFPTSARALEAHALVLEGMGQIAPGGDAAGSALVAVRGARGVTRDVDQALRLAADEARLLLKLEDFARAGALADSLLAAWPRPAPAAAGRLAGLAALTGRADRAAALLRVFGRDSAMRTAEGVDYQLPPQLMDPALGLIAYASVGQPTDSLRALEQRLERLIDNYVEPRRREVVRRAALDQPATLAFPQLGLSPVHRPHVPAAPLLEMQWALGHGDTAAVRTRLAALRELRRSVRPGDVAVDETAQEAWLLVALGDTLAATRLLDGSLEALPTLGADLLWQVPQAGGLVRAMVLRAELAAAAQDVATARRWARAVVTLWAHADPALQPTVAHLRALARAH